MSARWPEIQATIEKQKKDLKLTGPQVAKRLEDAEGVIDSNLWTLSTLVKLEISGLAALELISPDIEKLQALKELILSDNKLKELPEQIGKLIELKIVIAANNLIQSIPIVRQSASYL